MPAVDKLINLEAKALKLIKGHPFPIGFDQWCQLTTPPPKKFFPFPGLEALEKEHSGTNPQDVADDVVRALTEPGKHWANVSLNLNVRYNNRNWDFHFPIAARSIGSIVAEDTHIWNFEITTTTSWITGNLQITNLMTRFLAVNVSGSQNPIRIVNCVIGRLSFSDLSDKDGEKPSVEIHDCLIGTLILHSKSLKNLTVTRGGIAEIRCPSSDSENPFTGDISFKKVFFPSSKIQTRLFQGAHSYRSLYAHLKKLDNTLMANLMRSHQLRTERAEEDGFTKMTNWIYGTFSNYGMSPGRPLLYLIGLYAFTVVYLYYFDGGTLAQSADFYKGAHRVLLEENDGRLNRSLQLPAQSIVNPFGIFFDPRKFIVPTTSLGSWLLILQGLFSDMCLAMTALSIRRRFKAE